MAPAVLLLIWPTTPKTIARWRRTPQTARHNFDVIIEVVIIQIVDFAKQNMRSTLLAAPAGVDPYYKVKIGQHRHIHECR